MKELLFFTAMLLMCYAKGQTYSFDVFNEPYNDLESSISLNKGMTWDDPEFTLPLGFEFELFTEKVAELYIDHLGLGGLVSTDSSDLSPKSLMVVYGADIIDRGYDFIRDTSTTGSRSNISYKVDGMPGMRIFKLEWNNVGFYTELADDLISSDFTNIQLWLYEETNDIEIRFGPTEVNQPDLSYDGESGPIVAMIEGYDYMLDTAGGEILFLEGDPDQPVLMNAIDLSEGGYLNGTVKEGTVYRFSRQTSDVSSAVGRSVNIYPNPTQGKLRIDGLEGNESLEVSLFSSSGERIQNLRFDLNSIDLTGMPSGVYYLVITKEVDQKITKRIVVE